MTNTNRSRISGQFRTGGGAYQRKTKEQKEARRAAIAELMAKNAIAREESFAKLDAAMAASGVGKSAEGK
jgi:hypothetical protein